MENVIWLVIMVPVSMLFTGIGIYAMKRRGPMWFWSGTTVREEEITDVAAYNRANGIMWILFSLPFWISTFMGLWKKAWAGAFMFAGCMAGMAFLVICYGKIYKRYSVKK